MVRVEFMGPIQMPSQEFDVASFEELRECLLKIPEVSQWLESSAIAVNDKMIHSLDVPLKDGDKVVLLPPVCGG